MIEVLLYIFIGTVTSLITIKIAILAHSGTMDVGSKLLIGILAFLVGLIWPINLPILLFYKVTDWMEKAKN